MKKYLLVVLAVCYSVLNAFAAVPYLLNESFEAGIPANWTQEVLSEEEAFWAIDTENTYPAGAFDGTKRIALRNATGENKGYVTRLITPPMNLASTPDPQLVFAYAQPAHAGFHDTLAIYFRLKTTSDWVLLRKFTDVQNRWREEVINLVATYGQATSFQLAFEANEWMGRGIVLDNIRIFPKSQCDSVVVTGVVASAHGAEIIWTGDLDATYEVLLDTIAIADPAAFDKSKAIYYNNTIDGYDGGVTVSNIPSSPNYYAYVRATCSDNESGYTNWATYRFATSAAFPFIPSFADSLPAMWELKAGAIKLPISGLEDSEKDGWQHTSSSVIIGEPHVYGKIVSYSSSYTPTWLITPLIDMQDAVADSIDLKFSIGISGSSSSATMPYTSSISGAKLHILVSVDEGVSWVQQDSLLADDLSTVAKRITVDMTPYKGSAIRIAFVITASSTSIYFHLGEIALIAMDPACAGISKLKILPTLDGADLSWSLRGTNKNAVVLVSSSDTYSDTIQTLNVSETSATISGLTANTSYYVAVRQDCNSGESLKGYFRTECDKITIDDGTSWIEGFEDMEVGSSTSDAPECWALLNANAGAYPYIYVNSNSSYVHTGSQSLYFVSSNSVDGYAIMPGINNINDMEISFSYKDESSTNSGYVELGYMTDPTNEKSFVSLVKYDRSSSWVTTDPVSLEQIPASDADRARVAFKYGGASSNYYMGIDDITITPLPFCRKIGKVAVSEITENGVVINFGATAHSQSYHVVLSTASIDPDTYATASSVVLSQNYPTSRVAIEDASVLLPNTHYYLYVRSFCGDDSYGEWSEEVDFHTQCTAFDIDNFGVEEFVEGGNFPCWTTDYRTKRTSDAKCSNTIVHDNIYGDYLLLSHEAVDTITHDGAYAITPQLAFEDGDNITSYQVTFSAATTSQATTNIHKLRVAIVFSTSDLSIQYTVKTIDLDYAADSTTVPDYTVTFANYPGYMGYYGAYVMFAAVEAAEHDSTNYILIDNVSFERASSCPQVIKSSVSGIDLNSATLKWEDTGAPEYEVMVSTTKTRQPESLTDHSFWAKVDTNIVKMTPLNSSTQYYAYVRSICGVGDSAKWSNPIAFRTMAGVPYLEPFEATSLADGWQSLYGAFTSDSVATSSLAAPTGDYAWTIASEDLPTGMAGYAACGSINDYWYGYPWLISPVIDMRSNKDDFIEMSFKLARSASNTTNARFYVAVSTDGGKSWKKENTITWMSGGDYEFNDIPTGTAAKYRVGLSKYVGQVISIAFYMQSPYSMDDYMNRLYLDSIDIHTYEAVCMGASNLNVNIVDGVAVASWDIEGTPVKTQVELSDIPTFDYLMLSTEVDNATTLKLPELQYNSVYYLRVKQAECSDTTWLVKSFATPRSIPFEQSFNLSSIPSDWSFATGVPASVFGSKPTSATSGWSISSSNYGLPANHAKVNIWSSATSRWLISPVINLSKVATGDSLLFEFDAAYTDYGNGDAPESSSNQALFVLVSIDGGKTWLQKNSWEWSDSDSTANVIYSSSKLSNTGTHIQLDFSQFAGADLQIAFVGLWKAGDSDFHIANVSLKKILHNCEDPTALTATGGLNNVALTWAADSAKQTIVELALNKEFTRGVHRDTVNAGLDTIIGGLQPGTLYYARVRQICKGGETDYSPVDTAITECSAITDEVWYENFDMMETGSKTSVAPALCWNLLKANGIGISASTANYIYVTTTATYVHTPNKCLYFQNNAADNAYVILPEIADLNTKRITLYHTYSSVKNSGSFVVGYITDITSESTFVALDTIRHGAVDKTPTRAALSLESFPTNLSTPARLAIAYCGGTKTAYAGIDDITIEPLPTCLTIEDLAISNITGTSAVASFSANPDANHYEVMVATEALDVNWNLTVADSAEIVFYERNLTQPQCEITGLVGSTAYYVYVRVACDADEYGDWSEAAMFHTDCPAISSYPWHEDFDGYAVDDIIEDVCWRDIHSNGTGTSIPKIVNTVIGSNTSNKLSSGALTGANKVMVATPYFTIPVADKYEFSIDVYRNIKNAAHKGLVHVYISSSDTIDASAFKLASIPRSWSFVATVGSDTVAAEKAAGLYTYTFAIPQSGDWRVILEFEGSGTASLIVDNFGVREIPDCADVRGLKAIDVTGKSAIVTLDSVAAQYQFIATSALIDPDTLANVPASVVAFNVLQPKDTADITGLKQLTTYYIYARTLCEEGYGYWSEPITIKTACGSISDFPWTENFNNISTAIPECWDNSKGTTSYTSYRWSLYSTGHSGNCLRFDSYTNTSGNTNILALPSVDLTSYAYMSFYWKNPAGGAGSVLISTDGGAHTTVLESNLTNVADWTLYEIDLSAYQGKTVNIYFSATSNYGYGDAYLYLDDITIDLLPTCRVATNLHANVSDTSAIVTFDMTNEGANFQVITANSAIVPARIDGAGLDMSKIISIDTVAVPRDTVYGLVAQTKYYVYVRVLCDDSDKSAWASADFTTACSAIDIPYTMNFESELANFAPSCWTVLKDGGSYPYVYNSSSLAHGGSKCLAWGNYYTSTSQYRSWVSLPALNAPINTLEMSFWISSVDEYVPYYSYSSYEQAHDSVIVGVMTDPTDKSTFVRIQGFQPKSGYEEVYVDFSSYTGEGKYIAFFRQPLGTPSATGAYAYGYSEAYDYDLPPLVDDINVHVIPACPPLRTFEALSISAASATISLGSNTTTDHEVVVTTVRVNPDTLNLVPASIVILHEIGTANSYELKSLTPSTTYFAYARNTCDASAMGAWRDISFTTAYAASVPFDEDFSQGVLPEGWSRYSGLASSVFAGGKLTTTTSGWLSNTNVFGNTHPKLNVYGPSCNYWIMTPNILIPEVSAGTGIALEFDLALSAFGNSGNPNFNNCTDDKFIVAISTDGGATWQQQNATIWASNGSGQYSYTSLSVEPERITIDLTAFAGQSIMIAFYGESTVSNVDNDVHIDNISINMSNLNCLSISDIALADVTTTSAKLGFRYNGGKKDAVIVLSKANAPDYSMALLVDTIYNDSVYSFSHLQPSTLYNVFIARLCDEEYGISGWKKGQFSTALGVRFEPIFTTTEIPADWGRYSGPVNNVLAGTAQLTASTSGWYMTSADTVIGSNHFRANIYGTSFNYWVVTPSIDLTANVGDGLLLHFDAGLTAYSSGYESSRNDGVDDRFVVLVSSDDGAHWTKVAEWNNSGTGDYIYNDIPSHASSYHLDLTQFAGRSIRIGFYGESTQSNADNYFHFGNIILDKCVAETYTARVCQGDDYDGSIDSPANCFYVEFEDYEVGLNIRSEYRPAIDEHDIDSMLVLNLTVDTAARYSYAATICEGEHYADNNFDFTAVYGMRNPSRIISTTACDSVVELLLTVNPKLTEHIYDSVIIGDAYIWHGDEYYIDGNYPYDTVSAVTGCDSVAVLHLKTYVPLAIEETSVYNLQLSPNPVEKGQPVYVLNSFSPAELAELRLDVFSASGALVYSASSLSEPLIIPGLSVSGLHLVRISTPSGRYISPLIVK